MLQFGHVTTRDPIRVERFLQRIRHCINTARFGGQNNSVTATVPNSTLKMPPVSGKKAEKKAGKKAGRVGGDKKRKKKRKESYSIYIYKVLKQVHPDTGVWW
eukprot:sb/3478385/